MRPIRRRARLAWRDISTRPNRFPSVTQPAAQHTLQLSELIGALSCALDMTEGQPVGHSMRCGWIGMHIGRRLGLEDEALRDLYYVLLLKDLGCSSNAAKLADFYGVDDLAFKRTFKTIGPKLKDSVDFLLGNAAKRLTPIARARALVHIFRNAGRVARELIETRCHRGADIARQLRFSESVAEGIQHLDEHWDGGGLPDGLGGEAISLHGRIALLAQAVDVFHTEGGPAAALGEARRRSGAWFDPRLVEAFEAVADDEAFWSGLKSPTLDESLMTLEPARTRLSLDEDWLDDIAAGFGQVIDAKSPYTSGHSTRVAAYAEALGEALEVAPDRRRWLRRAALLHDVGKLGVSSTILEKPGRLASDEWVAMKGHAEKTQTILSRIGAFDELARVSAAHHEKLDGTGYPLGLRDTQISLETRIITACDFFDALTADRPYRAAMSTERALEVMRDELGRSVDPRVFAALEQLVASRPELMAA